MVSFILAEIDGRRGHCYKKVFEHLYSQLDAKTRKTITDFLGVYTDALGKPSIGRGMIQGGFDCLKDDFIEKMEEKEKRRKK